MHISTHKLNSVSVYYINLEGFGKIRAIIGHSYQRCHREVGIPSMAR